MSTHLLRKLGIDADHLDDPGRGTPGHSSMTSRLTPAPQVIFRVADPETARALGESLSGGHPHVQREAEAGAGAPAMRDANGVAEGAEHAVARAAGSSGAPLPEPVRERFESSLGADLSSVRVHTGGDSVEANQAVGAKAYTVGNDIHFNEGQYQPDDPFGMHLLAHEVAHTVQQAGGAARRQHKLEVSTPQDALEHEADRAADAMVRGAPTSVGGASGLARAPLMRQQAVPHDPDDWDVEPLVPGEEPQPPKPVGWGNVSNEAVSLEAAPEAIQYTPTFNEKRAQWWQEQKGAFMGVATGAVFQLINLVGPVTEFKGFAADAEKASANFVHDDPNVGIDNITLEGSDTKIGHAFKDDAVAVSADKTGLKKFEREERMEIKQLKDQIGLKTAAVNLSQRKISDAANGVVSSLENVVKAANSLQAARNDVKAEELGITEGELDAEKTRITNLIGGIKAYLAFAKGFAGEGGKPDAWGVADASLDIANAAASTHYDNKIIAVKKDVAQLGLANAKLAKLNAGIDYAQSLRGVPAAMTAMDEANTGYKTAVTERTVLFETLSLKIEKSIKANGGTAKEAAAGQAAVQAIPLMEEVIQRLGTIAAAAAPPGHSDKAGSGFAMCTNPEGFRSVISRLGGYESAARTAQGMWKKRLASANGLIGGMK